MTAKELIKILKKDGWYSVSQRGSPIKLKHKTKKNTIIVPDHGKKDLGKGLVNKILKDAELK